MDKVPINAYNVNKVLLAISNAPSELCIMRTYDAPTKHGMAHCIGGWTMEVMKADGFILDIRGATYQRCEYLGLSIKDIVELECGLWAIFPLGAFDARPSDKRQKAMTWVLAMLRDHYVVNWGEALSRAKISP